MTIATVILESDDPGPVLVGGVKVSVYDTNGVFVTSGDTNVAGQAAFDIPDGDYDLFFFKQAVSFPSGLPQRITVSAADQDTPPNTFKVIAHITALPEALDPLRCRISGSVVGIDGSPAQGLDGGISFSLKEKVETGVLGGNIVSPHGMVSVKPNANGVLEFELLRKVEYRALFYMLEELLNKQPPELQVIVPDLPALSLHHLLFPVLVSASFSQDSIELAEGAEPDDSVGLTLLYSDGSDNSRRKNPPPFVAVSVVSDNEDVATVIISGEAVAITPVASGVANITVTRTLSNSFLYDPVPAFATGTLEVTVV